MGASENQLIASLPRLDRRALLDDCETVELALSEVLCEAASPTRHAYFPIDAFVSLVRPVDLHPGLEVGMVGCEGMLGSHLALGVPTSPLRALVQGGGSARRIEARRMLAALVRSTPLRRILHRYVYVQMEQLTTSAACLRFHLIGPRLARWLLMSQDRAQADSFRVTQEFLAYMLGVRRVGITAAAGSLQRDGLIVYRRGMLTVLNRLGLESAACICYQADRDAYAALL